MGIYGGLMGSNGNLWWFKWEFMGIYDCLIGNLWEFMVV